MKTVHRMKTIARTALLLAVPTLLLAGCATAPKKSAEPVATISPAEALAKVRAEFAGSDAKLASVGEVIEGTGWFALADATLADFPAGTLVSVLDENATVVGYAVVNAASKDNEVYAVEQPGASRPVRVGDVAVKFPASK